MLNAPLAGKGEYADDLNGLIPATFADQIIKFRLPYSMPGELTIAANQTGVQFNANTFLHNINKPFEIHRMHVELTGMQDAGIIPDGQPLSLDRRVRLTLQDTAKNELLTKNPHLVSILQKANEHTWEWEVPYTLTQQDGITITVDTLALLPNFCVPTADCTATEDVPITNVRVEVAFQGYLVILAPANQRD